MAVSREQAGEVMSLLRSITHEVRRQLNSLFQEEIGLTLPQLIVLRVIHKAQVAPTSAEVVDRVRLAPSTLSGIIKRLERDGLIQREEDPMDLRVQRLRTTEKGEETIRAADEKYYERVGAYLQGFSGDEVAVLSDLLRRLHREVCGADSAQRSGSS